MRALSKSRGLPVPVKARINPSSVAKTLCNLITTLTSFVLGAAGFFPASVASNMNSSVPVFPNYVTYDVKHTNMSSSLIVLASYS